MQTSVSTVWPGAGAVCAWTATENNNNSARTTFFMGTKITFPPVRKSRRSDIHTFVLNMNNLIDFRKQLQLQ
jgi:hypothetical protein